MFVFVIVVVEDKGNIYCNVDLLEVEFTLIVNGKILCIASKNKNNTIVLGISTYTTMIKEKKEKKNN